MDGSHTASDDALPSFCVNTRQLPRDKAFGLWQDEVVPYWQASLLGPRTDTFESATDGFLIGDMMLGTVQTPSQRITRSRYSLARDGLSQYGLQIIVNGGIGKPGGSREECAVAPGDLLVADLTQTQTLEAHNLDVIYFSVPRHRLAPLLSNPDHHNERVVSASTPLAKLLTTHLATTLRLAPSLNVGEAETVMNVTLKLTAAFLNGQVTEGEADAVAVAITQNIRQYIERHIKNSGLTADAVAAHFRMSRRKLYYLFEPFGGFVAYVRERRLHHVRRALTDPAYHTRQIADIAEVFGFGNYASFLRAFRQTFEASPREVRALAAQGDDVRPARVGNNVWYDWLLRTR